MVAQGLAAECRLYSLSVLIVHVANILLGEPAIGLWQLELLLTKLVVANNVLIWEIALPVQQAVATGTAGRCNLQVCGQKFPANLSNELFSC